jgi:hypothetical protein
MVMIHVHRTQMRNNASSLMWIDLNAYSNGLQSIADTDGDGTEAKFVYRIEPTADHP